jgi:hypothetical protein
VDIETALDWRGRAVVDRTGEKIGTLKEMYLDADDRPTWASVHTGLFGLRQTLVPLTEARLVEDDVQLPYDAQHVKDAPSADPDVQLSPDEEDRLYSHYGLAPGSPSDEEPGIGDTEQETAGAVRPDDPAGGPKGRRQQQPEGRGEVEDGVGASRAAEAPAPSPAVDGGDVGGSGGTTEGSTDAGDGGMIRSEEEVVIGKRHRERRARLKKYVVTDYVTKTVPVQREKVRLEYEPVEGGEPVEGDEPVEGGEPGQETGPPTAP